MKSKITKKRTTTLTFSLLLVLFLVAGCSNDKQEVGHRHEEHKERYTCSMHPQIVRDAAGKCPICAMELVLLNYSGNEAHQIVLDEAQIRLGNITVKEVGASGMTKEIILAARIVPNALSSQSITSRAKGRIEKLYIKEIGQPIQKGQVLYELYSEQLLVLQNEYIMALEQHRQFKDNSRYTSFLEGAKRKLLLFGMDEGQINSLEKNNKTREVIQFKSPAAGLVKEVFASEGMYVEEGAKLYYLEDLDQLWVEADAYPSDVEGLRIGQEAAIKVEGYDARIKAKIEFMTPEYIENSTVIRIRFQLTNSSHKFIPGIQASVILSDLNDNTMMVPQASVIRDGKGANVWVETEPNTFKSRPVSLGRETADEIEVTEGLKKNERIVVSGAYLLQSEFILKKGN